MELKIKTPMKIHNRFDIEVIDAQTGRVKQKAFAENIVLDALWTRMLTPATYFNYIFFGTGTGTLSASRTSLFTHLGYKAVSTTVDAVNESEGWFSRRKQCQLLETEYVGSELSEVGIGYGTTSTNLVTHATLKDMNGNPITIEKTNLDIITIYATVFVHWETTAYSNGGRVFAGMYNNTIRKLLAGDYTVGYQFAKVGFHHGSPKAWRESGYGHNYAEDGYLASATFTYSAANKKISTSLRVPAASANVGGLRSVSILSTQGDAYNGATTWIMDFGFVVGESWYPYSSITGEAIGTGDGATKQFSTDFGFVLSGAKIYVDGVEQTSGVTVTTGKPVDNSKFNRFLEFISQSTNVDAQGAPMRESQYEWEANEYAIYQNPLYQNYGIYSFELRNIGISVSQDLVNWTSLHTASDSYVTLTIPEAYRNYRYWKFISSTNTRNYLRKCMNAVGNNIPSYNIVFDTAPANGAVITADYDCECIAKDANHVFDFSFEIVLGEKVS